MDDSEYLARALRLAMKAIGKTRPNPPVGAVLVKDGSVIGEGYHHKCGSAHAEVEAIRDARRRGFDPAGSTLYVTLEPCSRAGRVGACTDAIIAADIRRVVYAVSDPNPQNGYKAERKLGEQCIDCESADPDLPVVKAVRYMLAPYAKHVRTGLPYVVVKIAMSLDGRICDNWGASRWISCKESRQFVRAQRKRFDAVIVGAETIRKDNPSLLPHGSANKNLVRVVVSRSGDLPKDAQVFTDGKNETLVFDDAKKAIRELGKRGIMHVLCEGGLKLATSLAEAKLVDEWITVLSPIVVGNRPIAKAIRGFTRGLTLEVVKTDLIQFFGTGDF